MAKDDFVHLEHRNSGKLLRIHVPNYLYKSKDVPAHDTYQADPIHQAFIAEFKDSWEAVKVYDAD